MFIDSRCIVKYKLFNGTTKVMQVETKSNPLEISIINLVIPIQKYKSSNKVQIVIANMSGVDVDNLIVKDYLSKGETYIKNSLQINNTEEPKKDIIKGVNIGTLKNDDILYITYNIKNTSSQITNCLVSFKYYDQSRTITLHEINNQKTIHY